MANLNTLDIDFKRLDNGYITPSTAILEKALNKIKKCPGRVGAIYFRVSASGNGYHVKFTCRDCSLCREVFDDQTRVMIDSEIPKACSNVLWDTKTYLKHGKVVKMHAGEWQKTRSLNRGVLSTKW